MDLPIIEVQSPWFEYLVTGPKKVEGRKATPKWLDLLAKFQNDQPYVILSNGKGRQELFQITDIRRYGPRNLPVQYLDNDEAKEKYVLEHSAVRIYLEQEGLRNALPGIMSLDEGVRVYRAWSTAKELIENDFLAIEMTHIYQF